MSDIFDYDRFWLPVFDDMDIFVLLVDGQFNIQKANKALCVYIGKDLRQLQGVKYDEAISKDGEPVSACCLDWGSGAACCEKTVIFDPFAKKWFCVATSPVFDASRNVQGYLRLSIDVTLAKNKEEQVSVLEDMLSKSKKDLELQTWGLQKTNDAIKILYKELEKKNEELQKLDEVKSDFISVVSHELRTPLTTIKEAVSQILDGILGEVNPQQREFLDIAFKDVDRLSRIVNDLLDMSRIEAKKFVLARSVVDVVEIASGVMQSFLLLCQEKGIELEGVFSSEQIEVFVDSDKIIQVFTNLIGNALKFTDKGSIKVFIEDSAEGALICKIQDTGCGIAAEDIDKVFDKFQQFGRTAGAGAKGTGLGLAISKAIIELHGGEIVVDSIAGKGTSFIFTLPMFNSEIVLRNLAIEKIKTARIDFKKLIAFCVRLSDSSGLRDGENLPEKSACMQVFKELNSVAEDIDIVFLEETSEIFVLTYSQEGAVPEAVFRLLNAVKRSAFDLCADGVKLDFMYGYSVYPDDELTSDNLIGRAVENMVDEKEGRLKKSILIVDDEENMVRAIRRFLGNLGYKNISEAFDGAQALKIIEEAVPDLIILDMKMPNMNGYEVIGRLKEDNRTKDLPILIVSGAPMIYSKLDEFARVKSMPMVSKPFDNEDIERWVKYLL